MEIVLLTEERPEPEMATRLALLVLDLPLWNSEEDLAEVIAIRVLIRIAAYDLDVELNFTICAVAY